jgi:copper(I)-binding protein
MNRAILLGAAAALLTLPLAAPATAAPQLAVSGVWARPATDTGGVFLTVKNAGAADRLVAAASPVANHVELHESVMVMPPGSMQMVTTMRPVHAIAVAANATTVLHPGGYHVMLIGLKQPLKAGESFPLHLRFAHAGAVDVIAKVRPM